MVVGRRLAPLVSVLALVLAASVVLVAPRFTEAVGADGPAPCSAGAPPFAYRGFCATYGGYNSYYGSYGPGFPTPLGWALCAFPPFRGSTYPAPGYAYVPTSPPSGIDTSAIGPVGYAFSRADTEGFWNGSPGRFTADQAAVAAKLLFNVVAWHSPVPSMDPGVGAAYVTLLGWELSAVGATGPPAITIALAGGGTTFVTNATVDVSVWFPGTNRGVSGVGVVLALTNATFSATGSTTGALITGASGVGSLAIAATGTGPVTVTVEAAARVGQPGLVFYRPTRHDLGAQTIVAGAAPTTAYSSALFTSKAPPPVTGTVSIIKSGNDTAYWPISGAVFDVLRGTSIVDSLVVGSAGASPPSGPLAPGPYLIREVVAPPGYSTAPDQRVSVVASTNTIVAFTGLAGDQVIPATVTVRKVDASDGSVVAGATFHISFDATNTGSFLSDLGTCTTDAHGTCSPAGNVGTSLLPGRYRVTEIAPPPGYSLDPGGPVIVELAPGQAGIVRFADPPLVPQRFEKVATGNVDHSTEILAGAVIEVRDSGGHALASCTTDASGSCATAPVLVSGDHYCWLETTAPIGLAGGASGCFTAEKDAGAQGIVVSDHGRYVMVNARKVSTAMPTVGVGGAVFDLYRMDGGGGPTTPTPAPGASHLAGGTWVARTTSGGDGLATFPLQLPDFAYCTIEHAAPAGFDANPTPACTAVLSGVVSDPPTTASVTVADIETATTLFVAKTNATQPGVGVPGARYDLFVRAPGPSSTPPEPDPGAPVLSGLRWYASGVTSGTGHLAFTIPVDYQWCVKERTGPTDFILDQGTHCTGTLDGTSPDPVRTIDVAEVPTLLTLTGFKFNASAPGVGIPGASYALFVNGAMPPGFVGPTPPAQVMIPPGMELFATGVTDSTGTVRFSIPPGATWCLQELSAPPGFVLDSGLHCTAQLTAASTPDVMRIGLPEVATLAFTGNRLPVDVGLGLLVLGGIALAESRRRRGHGNKVDPCDGMIEG